MTILTPRRFILLNGISNGSWSYLELLVGAETAKVPQNNGNQAVSPSACTLFGMD